MKKKLFGSLTFILLVLSLVACNSNANDESKNSEAKTVTESKEENNSSAEKELVAGTEGVMIPWTYMENEKLIGFEPDLCAEIGERIGYDITLEPIEWSGLFGAFDAGRIDFVANIVTINEERLEKYYFTEPYLYNPMVIATKSDSDISSLEDIGGMSIVVEAGSSDEQVVEALEEKFGYELEKVYYDGISINDVELGRVDLWIGSEPSILANIEAGYKLKVIDRTGEFQEYGYPFPKTDEGAKLRDEFNSALDKMREDGTLSEISEKWLLEDYTQKPE